jgi:hypothetical protein
MIDLVDKIDPPLNVETKGGTDSDRKLWINLIHC